jgi:hypothetical protein
VTYGRDATPPTPKLQYIFSTFCTYLDELCENLLKEAYGSGSIYIFWTRQNSENSTIHKLACLLYICVLNVLKLFSSLSAHYVQTPIFRIIYINLRIRVWTFSINVGGIFSTYLY